MELKLSESIRERILQGAKHPKVRKAIDNIADACDYLDKQKITITIAEVGRLTGKALGGPTAPSLRNNKNYVDYVSARRGEQRLPAVGLRGTAVSVQTGDPEIDAYIYTMEVELRAAQNQIAYLRALLRNGEFDLEASLREKKLILAALPGVEFEGSPKMKGNRELAEALVKILEPSHLEIFGMVIDKDRVKSPERNLKVFLEKTEVEVLRREIARQRELCSSKS